MNFCFVKKKQSKKFLKALGRRIRELRKEQNISQDQLSFEYNTTQKHISLIEVGQINTTIAQLHAITEALGLKLKELLDFEY